MEYLEGKVLDKTVHLDPPTFMWYKGEEEQASDFRYDSDIVQHHYNKMKKLLENQGYVALLQMSERLEDRKSEMENRLRKKEAQLEYIGLQKKAYRDKYEEMESAIKNEPSLDTLIGRAWLDKKGKLRAPKDNAWEINQVDDGSDRRDLKSMRISYPPDEISAPKLRRSLSDSEMEIAFASAKLECTGDRKWGTVFDELDDIERPRKERRKKLRRTRDLLGFRFAVAELALYRFEAFGDLKEMSEEVLSEVIEEELSDVFNEGSKPLEYAEEIQQVYRENWSPPPRKMRDLKARLGEDGESKVTQLQTTIREAELSDRWENGNPESFCKLITRLVKQHYGI